MDKNARIKTRYEFGIAGICGYAKSFSWYYLYRRKTYNDDDCGDAMLRVFDNHNSKETMHRVFAAKNKFGSQSKNLASIIRGFKSAVTMYARERDIQFSWQPRFHDHIITSNNEYQKIADYILENPKKWREDKFCR